MLSRLALDKKKPVQEIGLPAPCALWPVDLKLTHVDCNPDTTLVHFQGQYLTISELDYNILQLEIQNAQKTRGVGEMGELCLVEDVLSDRWYRGRVQNKQEDMFDVFLIDHGNVLSVDKSHLALGSDEIFMLPPKIVCGFFANVLPLRENWDDQSEGYFSSLVGSSVKGYIQALLPHKVLILEAPDINKHLKQMGFGKHVDTDTFLLLVEILTEVPLKQSREPVPDLLIDKPSGQEFSFKPSSLQGFEDILSFCGPKLTAGKKVKVRITAAVSPSTFYCQMTSMAKDLQVMSEELAVSCENKSKDSTQKTLENLGLLCSVRGKDEKWHRGFVQFLPVNSRVRVLFVDYGFCESVKVEHVLQLPSRFLSTPIVAFPCALSCLGEDNEAVKTEQLSLLKKGLLGEELEAHIDSFDEENNIFSVTMFSSEGDIITQEEPVQDVIDLQNSYMYFESTLMDMLDDSVQAEEMTEDIVFEGYVEHVLNPSQFWMRTEKRNTDFEAMMDCLDKHFSQIQLGEDILANPLPGTICCAMYEKDMHYYRAIVTDTLKHGAEVFFMDFGNTEKVPHMLLKIIPEKLASVPAFAFSCSLVNVMPIDDDLWTTTTTNYFRCAARNKALLVHVVHVQKDRFVVDLFEIGTQNNTSISELLTRTNHATFWKYTPSGPAVSAVISKKSNGKLKLRKTEPVQGKEVSGTTTRDICAETAQVTVTNTAEKKNSTLVFKKLTLRPGSELAVCCSHIKSPSDFWCQIKCKIPVLDRLMNELQQVYETRATPLQSGDSCCMVKCKRDGRWYRACIIGKSKKDDYEVICVDYGITVREKVHLLQAILPKHLEIEGQAFRCSLYNLIEPADADSENWHSEAQVLLKDFIQDQSLMCSIRSQLYVKNHGLYNVVDLLNGNHSAAETLVGQGLAREVKTSVKLAPEVVPYSFVHSSFNLKTGSVEQVYTTHLVSPWEMYCQLDRNTDIIEDLMERVSKESEKMQSDKTRAVNCKLCLAKYYGDGRWYRGVVRPVPQSSLLNVFFVDYGNRNMVEKSNIISISSESTDLLFTPMQALRCSLAHIPKEEDFIVVHQWLEKSVLNQPLRAVVVGKAEDGTFEIDLFDGDVHINEKVKELIASQVPKSEKKVVCLKTDSTLKRNYGKNQKTPTKKAMCHKRQCEKKKSSPYSKSTASNCSDRKQKPRGTEGSCLKSENSPRGDQHDANSPSKKPLHTIEFPTLSSLPKDKITAGFRGPGFISHANHVRSFFIQMQDDEPSILKMGEDLNSELLKDTLKNNSVELKINDLVVAEYEEDGALYRAVVKDFEANSQYKLEFVDYGNTAVMGKEKTYCMISAWLSQPRLSIPCSLLDARCFDSDALFMDTVMGKPLMVEFVSCLGVQWEVNIEIMGQVDKPTLAVWPEAVSSKVSQSNDELLAVTDENKPPCQLSPSPVTKRPSTERFTFSASGEKIVFKVCHRAYATERLRKTRRQRHNRKAKTSKSDRGTVSEGVSSKTDRQTVSEGVSSKTDTVSEGVSFKTDSSPLQRLFLAPVNTDQTYSGFAAAVTTPYDFYIVLEDLLLIMNAVSTILEELPSELPSLPEADLNPLTCCLIRCDTKWCRAEVVHADRATAVVVNLVDYGHCVDTPYQEHSMLKRLPEQLTRLPKVTYPCALRGVRPATGEWTDQAALFFQESICQRNLEIHFRQLVSEERLEVDLVTDGTYIAKELVDAGHASYIDTMLGLRFQERSPIKTPPGLGRAEGRVAPDQRSALDRPESLLNTSEVYTYDAEESTRTNELLSIMDGSCNAEGCPSSAKTTPEESQSCTLTETLKDDQAERMRFPSLSETRHCE
ncbi:tudor domain-containing protein 15 [Osmerus mordax]|uniref:tudor domain-containing protein 15 n=1 Tax=Osmerus mordax TaxID=8014 RepID=UPI00351078BC